MYGNTPSDRNEELMALFHRECEAHGVMHAPRQIFHYLLAFPERDTSQQLSTFDL